jgi:hypothetical protein
VSLFEDFGRMMAAPVPWWVVLVVLFVVLPPLFIAVCELGGRWGTALADWQYEWEQRRRRDYGG